jgi:hypothetical protein
VTLRGVAFTNAFTKAFAVTFAFSVAAACGAGPPALAADRVVVFTSGHTLTVKSWRAAGDVLILEIEPGRTVTVPRAQVERVKTPDPNAVAAFDPARLAARRAPATKPQRTAPQQRPAPQPASIVKAKPLLPGLIPSHAKSR